MAEVSCPFVGLVPFAEEQSRFFFGRERETRLVINNLFASRLTLLYGLSGVGKSSLLLAGVKAQLARETRDDGEPEQLVVYLNKWQGDVMARFRVAVDTAVRAAWPEDDLPSGEGMGIAAWLGTIAEKRRVDVFVLLDQFEEYFLYHSDEAVEPFSREFAAALKTRSLPVSFLLGMRDDALARLDRFKVLIPDLFGNYLRLEPLSEVAAEMAIQAPILEYNKSSPAVEIEIGLVRTVLEQVRKGEVEVGPGGRGRVAEKSMGIEAPYLQLVMTRIWNYEQEANSPILRAATLEMLGGAQTIVREHLGQAMEELSAAEQGICVHMFQHLVTPSGTKIAHSAEDLAKWAKEPIWKVERLLARLSGTGMRLLVSVAPVDAVGMERFEIYHDALGQAMLDWRERRVEDLQRAEVARWRRLVVALIVATVLVLAAMGYAWVQSQKSERNAQAAADNAALARDNEKTAKDKTREVENLLLQLDEKTRTEVEALELQGKFDEAERLRTATVEHLQSQTQVLKNREKDVAELQIQLEETIADQAKYRARAERAERRLASYEMENDLGMRFRRIRAGKFNMGSPQDEPFRSGAETLREVSITRDYWMAETEVTQGQWQQLMGSNPSSFDDCGDDCPVEMVTWFGALAFANRLSERYGLTKCYVLRSCSDEEFTCSEVVLQGHDCGGFRLPTEAEWEYAARSGTVTPFWTGENLTTYQANYNGFLPYVGNVQGKYRRRPVPVKSFDPNPWGIYDVHGNVREWVWDLGDRFGFGQWTWSGSILIEGETAKKALVDPTGSIQDSKRIVRGGGWNDGAPSCRAAARDGDLPDSRKPDVGFRLVKTYP